MKKFRLVLEADKIQAVTGGVYQGAADQALDNVCDPAEAISGSVVFCEREKFLPEIQASIAGLVVCTQETADKLPGRNLLIHPNPYLATLRLVSWWLESDTVRPQAGIHPTAVVDASAQIGRDVCIGAFTVVEANCWIGDGCWIGEQCYLGKDSSLGGGSRLYPRVTVYHECVIGASAIIHSGVVIGADGFGFLLMDGAQQKIPQVGNVRVGDNVEIGANSCIDRGTLVSTVVGDGTKIDNMVQIGHNCRIGKHCIICAQVGLAGSTVLEDLVYLGGQAGSAGHLTIGTRAMVGGGAGVTADVAPDARVWGTPARDISILKRIIASQKHLPEMYHFYQLMKKNTEN